jgi:RF-1 domain
MGYDLGMNRVHPACLPIDELLAQCEARHERRSGPGGQHRNKVATAVVLTHRPTGVRAEANERRSQAENHAEALRRLRVRLAVDVRSPVLGETSALWQSRVSGERLAVNPAHDDFPALLAEALDVLIATEYDLSAAAARLGITATQLARFLQHEPLAWAGVNEGRRQRGLRPLH